MFNRRHIVEYPALRGVKVHPAFYVKKSNSNSSLSLEEAFASDLFRTFSKKKLDQLWDNAEKVKSESEEIPVYFYKERENGTITPLSEDEMRFFNFNSSWHFLLLELREDVTTKQQEHPLLIIFDNPSFKRRAL